jgi:hypothetical protein
MDVAPALVDQAFRIGADEEEFLEVLVALASDIGRARDVGFAGVAEFEFRALFLTLGAADEKHGFPQRFS